MKYYRIYSYWVHVTWAMQRALHTTDCRHRGVRGRQRLTNVESIWLQYCVPTVHPLLKNKKLLHSQTYYLTIGMKLNSKWNINIKLRYNNSKYYELFYV